MKMIQKIIVGLCIAGSIFIGFYIKSAAVPKLKFESVCPDSYGNQPVFTFDDVNSEYLKELRMRYKLDDLFVAESTELEKVFAVTTWVHNLWSHNGWNTPIKRDAMSILEEVFKDHKSFRCVEYSIVTAACLNAIGIRSRILYLKTADVETRESGAGHVVNEVYIQALQKWVMVDAQAQAILALSGMPLNAVELQKAIADKRSDLQFAFPISDITLRQYINWVEQYLFYFETTYNACSRTQNENAQNRESLMLVPVGAKKPRIFQKVDPIVDVVYTHSVTCFYQNP